MSYAMFLDKIATEFEFKIENMLHGMNDEEQLKFLLSLQEWAQDMFDEPFSLRR